MAHPKQFTKRPRQRKLTTVLAGRARQRLTLLSQKGIGRKAVHEFTGLDHKTIRQIKNGSTRYIQRQTRDLIFSVPFNVHCDRALVPANKTQRMIHELVTEAGTGFTKSEIAIRVGCKPKPNSKYAQLEIGRKLMVTAKSQMRIEKLYNDAKAA